MIAMPITATKTYNEMVSSDPSIEAGLLFAGYTAPTVQGIRSWFGDRVVCDDANFKNYFLRLASPLADKFNAQLRIETIDKNFDPLVENYLERYTENGGFDTKKPSASTITETPSQYTKMIKPADIAYGGKPYDVKVTDKPAETEEKITPVGYKDKYIPKALYTKTGQIKRYDGKTTDTTVNDSDTKGLSKQNPMSSTNANVGDIGSSPVHINNGIKSLGSNSNNQGWEYSSAQEQSTTQGYTEVTHEQSLNDASIETYDQYKEGGDSSNSDSQCDTTIREYEKNGTERLSETRTLSMQSGGETRKGETKTTYMTDDTRTVKYGNAVSAGISSSNKALGYEVYQLDEAGSKTQTYSNDEKITYGKNYKERVTGRAGLTPQQALSEAITYLRTISPAFFDLMVKLEPAFLGVYDI